MLKAIITDFDGTLVDTIEANWRVYERAFAEEGLSISLDEYKGIYGMRFDDFMRTVGIEDADVAKRIRDLKTLYYPEVFDEIVPNRKLIDELVIFRKTGGKTAIASTARKENLMNVLEHFQLGGLFDLIYSANDVRKGKPDPEIYLKTMQQLGVTPEETLIYEDSEVGVQAAAASGAKYIRVTQEWFSNNYMDLVSVIVPAYNAEATIERCINSILSSNCARDSKQLFELEIIVVNDGSTDKTLDIVTRLQAGDKRIHLFTQENLGPSGSRARGLREAKGDYIAWCDSDDWVDSNWLLNMYIHLVEYNADISCCRATIDGVQMAYNPSEIFQWDRMQAIEQFLIHQKLNGCLWNKMIRREMFDGVSFDPMQWYWEDMAVVWQILKKVNRVVRCNEGTYHFVIHPESMCAKKITIQRVRDSLLVWDTIYGDCTKAELAKFSKLANRHRLGVYVGEMVNMFKDGLKDKHYEAIIKKELKLSRKEFRIFPCRNRIIASIAFLSMNFARFIVHSIYNFRPIKRTF